MNVLEREKVKRKGFVGAGLTSGYISNGQKWEGILL